MTCTVIRTRVACLLVGLGLVALAGCGPSTAKLTGKVTYKGTPLKGGTVTFIPTGGGETFSTKIQEDGTYSFEQIRTGKYKVCVETTSVKGGGAKTGPSYGGKSAAGSGIDKSKLKNAPPEGVTPPEGYQTAPPLGGTHDASRFTAIPPEYGDTEKTTLTAEVKGGVQQHDIPLD